MQYSQVLDIYRVQATGTMPGFKNFTNQMNQPSKQQQKKQNPKTKPPKQRKNIPIQNKFFFAYVHHL